MPTSRTLAALLVGVLACVGCAATPGESVAASEGELGAEVSEAGIAEGSPDAEGVLLLVNDRAMTADRLVERSSLTASVAKSISDFRTGPNGKPRWFTTLDEIDALPDTTVDTFKVLLADARTNGYVEATGFDGLDQVRIIVPDDIGLPPSMSTVQIEAGFDGLTPEQVVRIVRGRVTNTIDSSNERFTLDTIKTTHRFFTLILNNMFAESSPYAAFLNSLDADRLTLLGTMSAIHPTILLAEKGGVATYYMNEGSGYEVMDYPHYHYPIIMRSRVRLGNAPEGPGVRLFYPAWSAKVLAGPTTVVIESP